MPSAVTAETKQSLLLAASWSQTGSQLASFLFLKRQEHLEANSHCHRHEKKNLPRMHSVSYDLFFQKEQHTGSCDRYVCVVRLPTTSVSRDSRLSELWVSPPSQGSKSFSLCSPLILPPTAASVKLSVMYTQNRDLR